MNRPWVGGDAAIGASTRISLRRLIMGLRAKAVRLGVLVFKLAFRVFELYLLIIYQNPPDCARGVTGGKAAACGRAGTAA